jgi:hypothetical protein
MLAGVRIMMPFNGYRLYQTERPKSAAEIRHADIQTGQFAAAVSGLFRGIRLPGWVARAYQYGSRGCAAAHHTAEPAL